MKPTESRKRYNDYPAYFKELFGERVQKLSIDGGFTCPNRDGKKGTGGCTFCNNESFNPGYCRAVSGISRQIGEGRAFFARKYIGQKYLAYFQAYSNTYAPLEELRQKYEEALTCPDVVGLVIATRPDAVTDDVLDYIAGLSRRATRSSRHTTISAVETRYSASLQREQSGIIAISPMISAVGVGLKPTPTKTRHTIMNRRWRMHFIPDHCAIPPRYT